MSTQVLEVMKMRIARTQVGQGAESYTTDMGEPLHLTIVYEDGEDGWIVASVPAVPGALSQGRTRAEARANVLDALSLMLSPGPGEKRESETLHLSVA